MFLTAGEIQELTDRKRFKDQIRWFEERAYRFEISTIGRPKVMREEIERRLLSVPRKKSDRGPRLELVK